VALLVALAFGHELYHARLDCPPKKQKRLINLFDEKKFNIYFGHITKLIKGRGGVPATCGGGGGGTADMARVGLGGEELSGTKRSWSLKKKEEVRVWAVKESGLLAC
jgi:hypothetical protein